MSVSPNPLLLQLENVFDLSLAFRVKMVWEKGIGDIAGVAKNIVLFSFLIYLLPLTFPSK
jgi:hypothetical protein